MKVSVYFIFIALILCLAFTGYAADKKANTFGIDMALMFYLQSFIDVENYDDGVQTGMGMKVWFGKSLALRALVLLNHWADTDVEISRTTLGLSGGAEFHFAPKELSPYAGGLAGFQMRFETDIDTETDFYFGGMFGVELQIFKSISFFAEYDLIVYMSDPNMTITLGTDPGPVTGAQVGMLIYF
jgi:hypothetical protein